jgi:hypothetical protein
VPGSAEASPSRRKTPLTPETLLFIVIAILCKPLSVNTWGNTIGSHAQDYALISIKTVLATG